MNRLVQIYLNMNVGNILYSNWTLKSIKVEKDIGITTT